MVACFFVFFFGGGGGGVCVLVACRGLMGLVYGIISERGGMTFLSFYHL